MPRFWFDFEDGGPPTIDEDGMDFATAEVAAEEAVAALASLAKDIIPRAGPHKDIAVNMRDEAAQDVFRATISFSSFHR